jgi:lysozyme family protein
MTISLRQQQCLDFVLRHEGESVLHDSDGITKFGICSRFYPTLNIEALTRDEASGILLRDYWPDSIPYPLDLIVFDASVNCGKFRSTLWLQSAINGYLPRNYIRVDGVLGPLTVAALGYVPHNLLILSLLNLRLLYYHGLRKKRPLEYAGWVGRVTNLIGLLSQGCYDASRR